MPSWGTPLNQSGISAPGGTSFSQIAGGVDMAKHSHRRLTIVRIVDGHALDDHLKDAILALRRRIRFEDGRPYDARCSRVAAALESEFGWKRECGRLRLLNGYVCWQHCWNRLTDGRILDATADQFESRWLGDVVVLDNSSRHAKAYQPTPPGWTLTAHERAAEIELVAIQDHAEEPGLNVICTSWETAGGHALSLMTGWDLPSDLVDYTARVLRVRAILHKSITSFDLDGLLTMYEWARAVAARGGLWMSSEYTALLQDGV